MVIAPSLSVGGGVTERAIAFAGDEGTRQLETGFVPALGLALSTAVTHHRLQLSAAVRYQTSLHANGVQYTPDSSSLALHTPIRSHRLELGVTPALRWTSEHDASSVGLFVGYGLRALGSVAELRVPRYTLHGPLLRLELEVPLFAGVQLRLAGEAGLIAFTTHVVERELASGPFGTTLGGEAGVRWAITTWLSAQLRYRESRAVTNTKRTRLLRDIERYALLALDAAVF
jgi:hypothetical protein